MCIVRMVCMVCIACMYCIYVLCGAPKVVERAPKVQTLLCAGVSSAALRVAHL